MICIDGRRTFGHVLDFDDKKVRLTNADGLACIVKKSNDREVKNLLLAAEFLRGRMGFLANGTRIEIARILGYQEGNLYLQFCPGINVELGLKFGNGIQRLFFLNLVEHIFHWAASHGFLWGDFAPRNMVYDPCNNTLFLFDFEKELRLLDCSQSSMEFSNFARSYLYEEFSCFLLNNWERTKILGPIIKERLPGKIAANKISSRRKKKLLSVYFDFNHFYNSAEVQFVEDLMADIATPIIAKRLVIYPIEYWERIKTAGGYDEYAEHVRQYGNFRCQYQKFCYLQSTLKRFLPDSRSKFW